MNLKTSINPNRLKYYILYLKPSHAQYMPGVFVLLLFIAAYYPAFKLLFAKWANSQEYSHAFLTLPIALYMVWSKRSQLSTGNGDYRYVGLAIAAVSTSAYLFAMLTQVQTFIFISTYMTIIGALIYLAGAGAVKILATPLLLFLLLIPVHEQLYPQITAPLQLKVSQVSEFIIKSLNIPLLREGNVMHLPHRSFEVVEACSGLRSVISLLTFSLILGYFKMERIASKAVLLIASIPTAVIINIFRIVTMILTYHYFMVDLTEGTFHTITGISMFLLAILIFIGLQKMLVHWETK